jgi:broad specificity phosphatase PhoE
VTLILVRHGQSEGNARGVICGSLDVALTDRGHDEARRVGDHLASHPVAAVYSSALRRAAETGTAIARHHALEVVPVEALNEYHYGEAQGLTWPQMIERYQLTTRDWGRGIVPGEEGYEAFRSRVGVAIDAIAERHRDDLAVIACHGGTIIQTLGHLLGLPPHTSPRARVTNCSITILEHRQDQLEIVTVNDVCHLLD